MQKQESKLFVHWTLDNKLDRSNGKYKAQFTSMDVSSLDGKLYCIETNPIGLFEKIPNHDYHILAMKYMEEQWPLEFLNT